MRDVRRLLTKKLWNDYKKSMPFCNKLLGNDIVLDHYAIIDIPSAHSGMGYLRSIFESIGYKLQGESYLPSKQNRFSWLREESANTMARDALPQVVIADFNIDEVSSEVRCIIERCAAYCKPIDRNQMNHCTQLSASDFVNLLFKHIIARQWPAVTSEEYHTVARENELIAWVLAFGRTINHFGISIHLMQQYADFQSFNDYLSHRTEVVMNSIPEIIKGGKEDGISQSSTEGVTTKIKLEDRDITIPGKFLEFVWRYPLKANAKMREDYYQHFVPNNANRVIESLYQNAS